MSIDFAPDDDDFDDDWGNLPRFEGGVLFDKYLLVERIGSGGTGEVWRVRHLDLDTERALKLIKPEIAQNDKGWRRFQREAVLMAKINHPNAVAVYDFDRRQSVGYIEMEFVRGRSLADVLKERHDQPMPLNWTVQLLDQLCSALQDAHDYVDAKTGKPKPILHRDLKPSNLMLVDEEPPGENLKVLDLGIARMVGDEDLVGTPAYMSPEQIRGAISKEGKREIDGTSDLYSVGVILYQFLTGSLPFQGMSKIDVLAAHLNTPPPPMKQANPKAKVPPEVERVVMQCLEKDPFKRHQTAQKLAEAFRAAIDQATRPARKTDRISSWWVWFSGFFRHQ
jgi:serine/threonine protein kinase